jgi:hypothetical protein
MTFAQQITDYSLCIENFKNIKKYNRNDFNFFKCDEGEFTFDGVKKKTIKCTNLKGDFIAPKKLENGGYIAQANYIHHVREIKIEMFYDKDGKLLRIRKGDLSGSMDSDFFSTNISFNYVKDKCIGDKLYDGSENDAHRKKYDVQACAKWEDFLVAHAADLKKCNENLDELQNLHDKYFAMGSRKSKRTSYYMKESSKFTSRLEQNCADIDKTFGIYDSVKALRKFEKDQPTSIYKITPQLKPSSFNTKKNI